MANFKTLADEPRGGSVGMKQSELAQKIRDEKDPEKKRELQAELRAIREGTGQAR